MKFADINREYTKMVSGYLNNGYIINSGTMHGSQGEICRVDLTNGKEIIRIYIDDFRDFMYRRNYDGIKLVVGRYVDTKWEIKPNRNNAWDTIWLKDLEVLFEKKYYQIGNDWYGSEKQSVMQHLIQKYRAVDSTVSNVYKFTDEAHEIVLPFVKRLPKCKSTSKKDITSVYKVIYNDTVEYGVSIKGYNYQIK